MNELDVPSMLIGAGVALMVVSAIRALAQSAQRSASASASALLEYEKYKALRDAEFPDMIGKWGKP